MSETTSKIILGTLLGVFVIIFLGIFGLLLAFPIMWCWNYVMPHIWGLPQLSWGQAWCLHFLAGMLVKSTLIHQK